MRMRRVTGFILLMVCAWTLFNGKEIPFAANPSQEEKDRNYFTDLPVLTHEGKELRFYSDLLKDRVVLISFFYTNCPTAQMGLVTLFKLQKLLENRLGTDIYLFSLSVDPEKDHLKALQEYAAKFNPQKGWVFLSGKKEHLTVINQRLGNRNPNPELHIQLFVLGNLKTGHWMKLPETAHPYAVAEGLRTLAAEK
jgi:protein SCO1/2